MGRLQGKTAFVTGAGGGIGRAIADGLEREGVNVARVDIDGKTSYQCDVSDRAAVFKTMKRFVAEAGGLDMREDEIHRMLDVGIKGVFWCTQAATPHLVARGGGSIINLSSVAVSFGITNACVYSSIKGAIDTFTRQQAVELAPHGIRRSRTPLKRLAAAEDVAAAAVFLASDEARSIAGVTLKIDGAMTVVGP
jgi:NAD(P)-dependent dehydrogenase (short-subunit alcohol dehydrogenase family)